MKILSVFFAALSLAAPASAGATEATRVNYTQHIAPLFRKYCTGCHNAEDKQGGLSLQSYSGLLKGGENGKILVPKNLKKSRLIGILERRIEPFMPPEGNKGPSKKEIARLKTWIKAGTPGPKGISPEQTLIVPKIKPAAPAPRSIFALAVSPQGQWVAVARHGVVEILNARTRKRLKTLKGLTGDVTDLAISPDGQRLAAAAGQPGLFGEAFVWNTADWKPLARLKGHSDSLYAVALSPDGKRLATGGYDSRITVWNIDTHKPLKQITGHNGPIHDLDFHPTGKILASASGDRTVKLWDVATGRRLSTLGEPEKDQYAVAFSPDGKRVIAGGKDNRIRVWTVPKMQTSRGTQPSHGTQPVRFSLLYSRFAHEGAILRLRFSPDGRRLVSSSEDRTVKVWETAKFTPRRTLDKQPDWVTGLAVMPNKRTLLLGRMDGTLAANTFSTKTTAGRRVRPIVLPPVPVPPQKKLPASATLSEQEPNNLPETAQPVSVPAEVRGVLGAPKNGTPDADLFRIRAKAGQTWILETNAARSKSPADTKIEVLHADGEPVLRYQLQAVRDSYITFRPIDSTQTKVRVKNWQEMDLNQYLYMAGEVCRLFRMPQGPDSQFLFYANKGKRRCYFDTTGTVHAKGDPVYIVEAHPPGAALVDNGLPVFPLYYVNDDDGERELGTDSRLTFTAPQDGEYLIRVTDSRGFGGTNFKYTLTIRPPKPDFHVTLSGTKATVPAGSGQRLTVNVDRIDGFTGEIHVNVTGLPPGFSATSPIVVQTDHLTARGVVNIAEWVTPSVHPKPKSKTARQAPEKRRRAHPVAARKPRDWSNVNVTATAVVHGRKIVKTLPPLGPISVSPKPKVLVRLEPDLEAKLPRHEGPSNELSIAPGTTITAMLRIERNGFNGELKFDVDHLPHGVIVDNIGLNGILIRAGENERRIFLTASDWVPETTRQIHAVSKGQGNQASRPILLHLRRP